MKTLHLLAVATFIKEVIIIATLVSTWYGGILEVGRFTYENGIVTWIIFGFFYYIAALLFVKFIAPKIIESNIPTIPELFHRSFGKWPALIAIVCVILMTTPAPYLKILADLMHGKSQIRCGSNQNIITSLNRK